jgi:thiol-disulfide isomerase/thioredoxin
MQRRCPGVRCWDGATGRRSVEVAMSQGLAALLVVLVAATAFGLWRRRTDGAMRDVDAAGHGVAAAAAAPVPAHPRLTARELGVPLGARATLVQFSSAFCQPCRATRLVLAQVVEMVPGVVHVDIDAEHHLDLVRRLHVLRTPTVFILDADGAIRRRAAGTPRKADVIASLGEFLDPAPAPAPVPEGR